MNLVTAEADALDEAKRKAKAKGKGKGNAGKLAEKVLDKKLISLGGNASIK